MREIDFFFSVARGQLAMKFLTKQVGRSYSSFGLLDPYMLVSGQL